MVTLNGCETVEWQDSAAPELRSPFDSTVGEIHKALVACKMAQSEADRFKAELKKAKEKQEAHNQRLRTLAELALPNALHAILIHAGIETMGQLEDLRGEIIAGRLEWPKGIGPAKVTLIEDRIMDWLEEHRNMEATAEDGQEEETPEEDG